MFGDCLGENWQSLGQCPTADEQRMLGNEQRMFGDCRGGNWQSLGQCPTAGVQRMFGDCLGENWQSLGQCQTSDVQRRFGDCLGENWQSLGQCQTPRVQRALADCLPENWQSLGQCQTADVHRRLGDCLGGNWQSLGQCQTPGVQRALADCLGEASARLPTYNVPSLADCLGENWQILGHCQTADTTTYRRRLSGGKLTVVGCLLGLAQSDGQPAPCYERERKFVGACWMRSADPNSEATRMLGRYFDLGGQVQLVLLYVGPERKMCGRSLGHAGLNLSGS